MAVVLEQLYTVKKRIQHLYIPEYDYLFKVFLVGDCGVGKRSALLRFADDKFSHSSSVNAIGVDFKIRTIEIDDKRVKLQIWDTSGQEEFRTITSSYYRGADCVMIFYDTTNLDSFQSVKQWLDEVNSYARKDVEIVLVGTKADLEDSRNVDPFLVEEFAAQNFILAHLETSAKNSLNIEAAFVSCVKLILGRNGQDRKTRWEVANSMQFKCESPTTANVIRKFVGASAGRVKGSSGVPNQLKAQASCATHHGWLWHLSEHGGWHEHFTILRGTNLVLYASTKDMYIMKTTVNLDFTSSIVFDVDNLHRAKKVPCKSFWVTLQTGAKDIDTIALRTDTTTNCNEWVHRLRRAAKVIAPTAVTPLYRIDHPLGAFGVVFAADARLDDDDNNIPITTTHDNTLISTTTRVAYKTLSESTIDLDEAAPINFLREIHALRRIPTHENIVKFLGSGNRDDNCPFYLMELMSSALSNLIGCSNITDDDNQQQQQQQQQQHGGDGRDGCALVVLTLQHRLRCAVDTARGMAHLHQHKLVHADLNLSNLMVSPTTGGGWVTKIADFGTSRFLHDDEDVCRGLTATVGYQAAEILRREPWGLEVDIYSFGIAVTEMLCDGRMYKKESVDAADVHNQVVGSVLPQMVNDVVLPSQVSSETVKDLIRQCLDMHADKRPLFGHVLAVLSNVFEKEFHEDVKAPHGLEDIELAVKRLAGRAPTFGADEESLTVAGGSLRRLTFGAPWAASRWRLQHVSIEDETNELRIYKAKNNARSAKTKAKAKAIIKVVSETTVEAVESRHHQLGATENSLIRWKKTGLSAQPKYLPSNVFRVNPGASLKLAPRSKWSNLNMCGVCNVSLTKGPGKFSLRRCHACGANCCKDHVLPLPNYPSPQTRCPISVCSACFGNVSEGWRPFYFAAATYDARDQWIARIQKMINSALKFNDDDPDLDLDLDLDLVHTNTNTMTTETNACATNDHVPTHMADSHNTNTNTNINTNTHTNPDTNTNTNTNINSESMATSRSIINIFISFNAEESQETFEHIVSKLDTTNINILNSISPFGDCDNDCDRHTINHDCVTIPTGGNNNNNNPTTTTPTNDTVYDPAVIPDTATCDATVRGLYTLRDKNFDSIVEDADSNFQDCHNNTNPADDNTADDSYITIPYDDNDTEDVRFEHARTYVCEANLVLAILSVKYFESPRSVAEIDEARQRGIIVVPVFDGDTYRAHQLRGLREHVSDEANCIGYLNNDIAENIANTNVTSSAHVREYVFRQDLVRIRDVQDEAHATKLLNNLILAHTA